VTADRRTESQDIRVRQCTVRVRRRDGWAWGDPESYLDQVRDAIENALARAAADAGVPAGCDAVLTEPVTLGIGPDGNVRPADLGDLTDRLRAAAREVGTGPAAVVRAGAPVDPARADLVPAVADGARPAHRDVDGARIAATLAAWSRSGRLAVVVSGWTPAARSSWLRALHEAVATTPGDPVEEQTVATIARAVLPTTGRGADLAPVARALVLAGAVLAALGDRLPDRRTLGTVLRVAGLDSPSRAALGFVGPGAPAGDVPDRPERVAVPPPGPTIGVDHDAAVSRARSGPVVVPALPFLVVVQLGRLGYLEPAATALAVSGLAQPEAVLAAMLAGKVVEPPAHGWLRSPAERDALRLASGLEDDVLVGEIAMWEPRAGDALAPLAAVLVGLYAADRSRFAEVALTRIADGGCLIGEPVGHLPIGWVVAPEQVTALLEQLGDPPVVESDLLADLANRLAPRRALLSVVAEELERHLGAAVGTGLGSLAQDLWGGAADPVVALERLGDLEARIEITDRLTIGVPRGQRWLDLKRAGLVDAWPAAWAPGGLWELVTW
jgi:hypothetical protein